MAPRKNETTTRTTRGRPFAPGNPGRPPGARHKTTLAIEALLDGDAETLTRKCIELAKAGDMVAMRICMDRIAPIRKGRPVQLDLPEVKSIGDLATVQAAIVRAMAAGEVSTDEAADITKVVEAVGSSLERRQLEARIVALETKEAIA